MKWLKELENHNISFHIHILQKEDSILIKSANANNQIIYILDGFAKLVQVFTNNEKICVNLLQKHQTIIIGKNESRKCTYYYLVTTVRKSIILTIPWQEFNKAEKNLELFSLIQFYKQDKEDKVTNILSHRNTKKRVVQLLIDLIKQIGEVKEERIILPLSLSHEIIATITGSQRITINRIMRKLKKDGIIDYSKKNINVYSMAQLIRS